MYALFFPSAQSFISSVEEKVKVEERIISVTIGPLTPRRFGSALWIDKVSRQIGASADKLGGRGHKSPVPEEAETSARPLLRRVARRARPCAWRSLFPRVRWARSRSVKK